MKKSVVSNGDEVQDTATVWVKFIMQGGVKLQLEAAEHKDVIFCPSRLLTSCFCGRGDRTLYNKKMRKRKDLGIGGIIRVCKFCADKIEIKVTVLGAGQKPVFVQLGEYVGIPFLDPKTAKEANVKESYSKMCFGCTIIGPSAWKRPIFM